MSSIKSPLSVTLEGIFETASFLERDTARLNASLGDAGGGGLFDRPVGVEVSPAKTVIVGCNWPCGRFSELSGPYVVCGESWRTSSEADLSSFAGGAAGQSDEPAPMTESPGD